MKQQFFILMLTISIFGLSANVNAAHHEESDSATETHKGKKHKNKHRKSPAKMLKRVDANQDGQVDLSEFLANAEERFNKMDLNSDGILTLEEAQESHKLMREKHKAERKARRAARKAEREGREESGADDETD